MEQDLVTDVDQSNAMSPQIQHAEKMVPQSKVNEIIQAKTAIAAEKARREMQAHYEQAAQSQSMGGMQQMSPDSIRQLIADETQRRLQDLASMQDKHMQEQEAQRIASEFHNKISAGKSRYDDFDSVMQDVDLSTIPHIVQLAHGTDNTADVMYELLKNPAKIAALTTLSYTSPPLARREVQKLSESIKNNQAAQQQKSANDPLSQISPTTVGADSGSLTLKDLKKASWLKR